MIIALDTSTSIAGVALFNETGPVAECTWRTHNNQTAQLLPVANRLMEQQGITPDALTGVAVALGPGSFNGLRVGVSAAKGIALALDIPIFGISSLDILAYQHSYLTGRLCAVIEAGRGRLAVGWYKVRGGKFRQQGDYENLSVDEIIENVTNTTFFCGELKGDQAEKLLRSLENTAILVSPASGLRRAGFLAELAWQRLMSGDPGDNLENLQPLYLHQPVK